MTKGRTKPTARDIKRAGKQLRKIGITDVHGEAAVYRAVEEAKKLLDNLRVLRPDLFPSKKKSG